MREAGSAPRLVHVHGRWASVADVKSQDVRVCNARSIRAETSDVGAPDAADAREWRTRAVRAMLKPTGGRATRPSSTHVLERCHSTRRRLGRRRLEQPRYETIGHQYARFRREDPRIRARIRASLGNARSVVNVGAGAGSYEPTDLHVVAIEPSDVMAAQRPPALAPAIRATADSIPLRDDSVDAAMAILTLHHWDRRHAPRRRDLRGCRLRSSPAWFTRWVAICRMAAGRRDMAGCGNWRSMTSACV